jgi:hypothetical protein
VEPRFIQHLRARASALDERGLFSPSLFLGDTALAAWLGYALLVFTSRALPPLWPAVLFPLAVSGLAWVARLHLPFTDTWRHHLMRFAAFGIILTAGLLLLRNRIEPGLTDRLILWAAGTMMALMLVLRRGLSAFRRHFPDQPLEMLRWLLLVGAAVFLFQPYYFDGGIGTGDAHWYTVMLSDFLAQLHAGVFPVWTGQSEFAFNGAVSPLRFAPWFQYAGGLLDLVTLHALTPLAVKNAVIAVNGLAIAAAGYVSFRDLLPQRPGIAAMLALLYLASPGVLAPLCSGNLYMTFLAMPFIPIVLNGLCRTLSRGDASGDLRISAGLAALWLSHAPVAMWTTLGAAILWLASVIRRSRWSDAFWRIPPLAGWFLALGSLPFLSILALDNQAEGGASGATAATIVHEFFPANFWPVDFASPLMTTYQVGYSALFVLSLALVCRWIGRARGFWPLVAVIAAIVPWVVPVPGLTDWLWIHAPGWLVNINNVWPTQRLGALLAALMLFAFAQAYAVDKLSRSWWLSALTIILLAGALGWSGHEALKFRAFTSRGTQEAARVLPTLDSRNAIMTRFAYSSFSQVPAYCSHGYMDPVFENRIIDDATGKILASNADTAAPLLRTEFSQSAPPRLVRSGQITARLRQATTTSFDLSPSLRLEPGKRYALRLEFAVSDTPGLLILQAGRLYREYLLPDSGSGLINSKLTPRSFGSLSTSCHVLPLQSLDSAPVDLSLIFLARTGLLPAEHQFARFWLYTYEPDDLAVALESLLPFRARVDTARPALVETPRLWLGGYQARVDGLPVIPRRSAENLVAIPVGPGPHRIELQYSPPWWLIVSFWTTLVGWLTLATRGGLALIRAGAERAPALAQAVEHGGDRHALHGLDPSGKGRHGI